jgi:hypothetical protein
MSARGVHERSLLHRGSPVGVVLLKIMVPSVPVRPVTAVGMHHLMLMRFCIGAQ